MISPAEISKASAGSSEMMSSKAAAITRVSRGVAAHTLPTAARPIKAAAAAAAARRVNGRLRGGQATEMRLIMNFS